MKSGKYRNTDDPNDIVHLDIDGLYSLNIVSGTINNRFKVNTNWIARVERISSSFWEGDIWYKHGFIDNFTFISVLVSEDPTPDNINVTYKWLKKSETRKYQFISESFRSIQFEFDHESNIRPILSFNTGDHEARPENLPIEELTVPKIFQRSGIDVDISTHQTKVPMMLSGDNGAWSDRELHDTMMKHWSRRNDGPQWAMWVFFAGLHEGGGGIHGKMFDNIGNEHRQGIVVFNKSVFLPPTLDPNKAKWIERARFFTLCHEIGHGFNMAHSSKKGDLDSWIQFPNEEDEYSFLGDPNAGKFFESFEYKFSNSELLTLRHAPEQFVKMGDAPWFSDNGFANLLLEQTDDFILQIWTEKTDFEYLEPVVLSLKLTNVSDRPKKVEAGILKSSHRLKILVEKKGSTAKQHRGFIHNCLENKSVELVAKSGEISEAVTISISNGEWIIADPGHYLVQVALEIEGQIAISNRIELKVCFPGSREEERLAQDYFSDSIGRILAFGGSQFLEEGNIHLQKLEEALPASNALLHAKASLALPYLNPFKSFISETKLISIRPADEKMGLSILEDLLEKQDNVDKALQTFGKLRFQQLRSELEKGRMKS